MKPGKRREAEGAAIDPRPAAALSVRAEQFRLWADTIPAAARAAEWECDFDGWPEVWEAVRGFLDPGVPAGMDTPAIDDLLFLLARDNETETIARDLAARPLVLLPLAGAAVWRAEPEARWQLADALGNVEGYGEAAARLLCLYCQDPDEYTRRRALLALGRRGAPEAEALAQIAWESGLLYQRLAALQVLADLRVAGFWDRHADALADETPVLAAAARRLAMETLESVGSRHFARAGFPDIRANRG